MKNRKEYLTEPEMRRNIKFSLIGISLIIVLPILAYNSFLKPESEPLNIWFQRSASFMTILCVITDIFIFNIHCLLNPRDGLVSISFKEFKKKYSLTYRFLAITALFLTLTSTLIWGYGDLLINL